MSKLALLGGTPVRSQKDLFPSYNTIGTEEEVAVQKILKTGNLSQFLGAWHSDFDGGPTVKEFEKLWAEKFQVAYATSVNSNTSGLFAAIGACEIQPGDEVIVSPYTMSASALAPMIYGGVPVFADIDKDSFCMDPDSIRSKITPLTKAILVVHIFGNVANMVEITKIAKEFNLLVIEDCAQAPGATHNGVPVGLFGDIGVFSLNYHKHIHTGEGGVIVTNSSKLNDKIRLIRNHGENIVGPRGDSNLINHWGYNFRMTEIEAAIGIEQLKKLDILIEQRIKNVEIIESGLSQIEGLTMPSKDAMTKHVYYVHAIKYDTSKFENVHRNRFVEALKQELPSAYLRETAPLLGAGYVKPLYLQPLYQQRAHPCSFNCKSYSGNVDYSEGICPVAENMHFHTLLTHEFMRPGMQEQDIEHVVEAFIKVSDNISDLIVT
ncbi:MAG TPA: DegT/DnrJ/EryC1/StrS family aminotransferase [Saprospiraceae bacterium]|nr:DegT/DnrJ/EryC1/StrS family aminotransferase [Saprospiraceae bacterium]